MLLMLLILFNFICNNHADKISTKLYYNETIKKQEIQTNLFLITESFYARQRRSIDSIHLISNFKFHDIDSIVKFELTINSYSKIQFTINFIDMKNVKSITKSDNELSYDNNIEQYYKNLNQTEINLKIKINKFKDLILILYNFDNDNNYDYIEVKLKNIYENNISEMSLDHFKIIYKTHDYCYNKINFIYLIDFPFEDGNIIKKNTVTDDILLDKNKCDFNIYKIDSTEYMNGFYTFNNNPGKEIMAKAFKYINKKDF